MRTTIDVPDDLFVEAERVAAERQVPLALLVAESLRAYLADQGLATTRAAPSLPVLRAPVPAAGVDLADTSRLWELE